jgi:sugar phosphate isomerase/epimerase
LIYPGGIDEILSVSERTGVEVKTICADFFMEAPLHSRNTQEVGRSRKVMTELLTAASRLGVTDIVVPCVDLSALNSNAAIRRLVVELNRLLDCASKCEVRLALETDLPAYSLAALLDQLDRDLVAVNYDIGNSAALGYDPVEELTAYGSRISDIHIKDRLRNGGPVRLGEGDAQFGRFFKKLAGLDYQGPLIMQAYRDDEGVEIFRQQLDWITPFLLGGEREHTCDNPRPRRV